jgi:hypothetical protein
MSTSWWSAEAPNSDARQLSPRLGGVARRALAGDVRPLLEEDVAYRAARQALLSRALPGPYALPSVVNPDR